MIDMNYTGCTSQPAFTCLKSTMEPPEQWVKSVQSNNKEIGTTSVTLSR